MTLKTKAGKLEAGHYRFSPFMLAAAAILALAACADGPPQDRGERPGADDGGPREGGPGRGGHVARLPNIFISPAGKPYRARPNEPYPVAQWFAEADANHDGKLTREEMEADAAAFFHTLDTNHDGVIDGFEVQTYEQTVAPEILPRIENLRAGEGFDPNVDLADQRNSERQIPSGQRRGGFQMGQPRGAKGETGTQGAAVYSLINQPEPVAAADADFDGKVTLAEFEAAADRHFEILDTKQQGYLTLAGLPKTPIQDAIEKAAKRRAAERNGERQGVDKPEF
jgi:hypothetical protein